MSQLQRHVQVINFAAIRGSVTSLTSVVPKSPGVYAWYKTFDVPDAETASADEFYSYLENEMKLPHMPSRTAHIAPIYSVVLSSHRRMAPQKASNLRDLCGNVEFRRMVSTILGEESIVFLQPLYVGKASNLRDRVRQHLTGKTPLAKRLAPAGVSLERCRLAYVSLSPEADLPDAQIDPATFILEEMLSRLFTPAFTMRYG